MADSTKRAGLTRREALVLSSIAGIGFSTASSAAASNRVAVETFRAANSSASLRAKS